MTQTRTDVHRPTALVTEDYAYAYAYDSDPTAGDGRFRLLALNDLLAEGYRFDRVHPGEACDHCGRRLRYVAVLKHTPSMTLIKVGETCLDNRFSLATREFQALRVAARLNSERLARAERNERFFTANPDLAILTYPEAFEVSTDNFIVSIAANLRRYADLSPRQIAAVRTALARSVARHNLTAERQRDARPAPSGRVTVTGAVVSLKTVDTLYGSTFKMVVRDDSGFSCYGTVPASINPSRGSRVTFTATLEVSDRDETFAFFKRPTGATLDQS